VTKDEAIKQIEKAIAVAQGAAENAKSEANFDQYMYNCGAELGLKIALKAAEGIECD
jgi:hypothetical protein